MSANSFRNSYKRLSTARIEFRHFKLTVLPKIQEICDATARFADLKALFSFYVDDADEDRLQLSFGKRSMFRKDHEGGIAVENGPTLLYTLGPTGDVAVVLYPAKSGLASVHEDHVFLGLGYFSGYQLIQRLPSDLRKLVAYGHVTSLDGDANWGERLQVWWLRLRQPMQVKGEFKKPASIKGALWAFEFAARIIGAGAVGAILKPIGLLIAALLLIYLGWPHLAELLRPR